MALEFWAQTDFNFQLGILASQVRLGSVAYDLGLNTAMDYSRGDQRREDHVYEEI